MAINIVDVLLSPSFWWVYVALFEFFRVFMPALMHMGSDKHVILQDTGHGYRQVGIKWVKRFQKFWGKNKGRISDAKATAYTEQGMLFDHGVQFTDLDHSMPLRVSFKNADIPPPELIEYLERRGAELVAESSTPLRTTFLLVPHKPTDGKIIVAKSGFRFVPGKEYSVNPDVGDMEGHVGRKTLGQLVAANALTHPGLLFSVLLFGVGLLGGLFGYPIIFPPHAIITSPGTTTTITSTVTTH